MGLAAPADRSQDREAQHGQRFQVVAGVLLIFRAKRRHGICMPGLARLHQDATAVQLNKAKSRPLLVPVVHEDRGARVGGEIPDALQAVRVTARLGFLVQRGVDA